MQNATPEACVTRPADDKVPADPQVTARQIVHLMQFSVVA
jgi:hypothetical protein